MPTLLMRLRAPMMSWGDHSRFIIRDSRREPTKSAIIGLLCAALGRPRWESIADLTALKMGVRVNQEGVVQCDYHTVQDSIKSNGTKGDTVVSYRYYIADADYLVGLEGELSKLQELDRALNNPVWQLYLGRKSFIPTLPVGVGIVETPLKQALVEYPYPSPKHSRHKDQDKQLRLVLETQDSLDIRQDVPLDWGTRKFGSRCVTTEFINWKEE